MWKRIMQIHTRVQVIVLEHSSARVRTRVLEHSSSYECEVMTPSAPQNTAAAASVVVAAAAVAVVVTALRCRSSCERLLSQLRAVSSLPLPTAAVADDATVAVAVGAPTPTPTSLAAPGVPSPRRRRLAILARTFHRVACSLLPRRLPFRGPLRTGLPACRSSTARCA